MYKHYSKIVKLFLIFIATTVFGIDVTTRTDEIKNNSQSSNIPYSFHYEKFQNNIIKTFDKLDLSPYNNTSLFVGYGLADKKEQNCYFVDNAANVNILNDFEAPNVIGKHSYLMSRGKMAYSVCKNLAVKYAGYVYNPETITSDSVVDKKYEDKSFWIGLTRTDCGSDWKNQYDITQQYNQISDKTCDLNKLNIVSKENNILWELAASNETHYCLLQIDSKDYLRPIKVCAPWWQIEQTYSLNCSKRKANLLPFYNMDIPKKVSVCVDLNNSNDINYTAMYNDKSNWGKYTCTSYYSSKRAESCKEDMIQDQCYVNECQGNVQKRCQLIGTASSEIKNYEIGTVSDNAGQLHKAKTKDHIKTHEYSCPPPKPSIANCAEYKTINVFPTDECNPGGCNTYFNCLNNNPNNITACDSLKSGCERKYGHEASVDYATKTINFIRVKCNDGREIENHNINEYSSTKSRCLEYNKETSYETKDESCEADLIPTRHSIAVGITEPDIYMQDSSCVRLNNEEDVPENSYYLDFNSTSYFKTKISKVTTLLTEKDLNSSLPNSSTVVNVLQDGNFTVSVYDGNTSLSVNTLSDLRDVFASVDSLIVGNDAMSQYLKNESMTNISSSAPATKEVEYDYFDATWWNKRIYLFNNPALQSITRPYSALAQCLEIPLDQSKSTFGVPSPKYTDGSPKEGALILRENEESNTYMENYSSDRDIMNKGLYCNRENNAKYIDWYGSQANDLYYNSYACSRLYGSDGKVWAVPYQKEIKYYHQPLEVNGTSVVHTVSVTDKASIYTTKTSCQTATGLTCKAVGAPVVVHFHAYYLSTERSATDKYKASSPSKGSSFDWVTGVNSGSLSADFLRHMGIDYLSIADDSDFTNWLDNAFRVYSTEGVLHEDANAHITIESDMYIPVGYELSNSKASRTANVSYYSYACSSGYTPSDSGLLTYSISDPNTNTINSGIFDVPNSSTPPENNCQLNNKSTVLSNIASNLAYVRHDPSNSNFCIRLGDIKESVNKKYSYADYNCSKYYGSNGKWDYRIKRYYLYSATHYKAFRPKFCGSIDFNENNITKDGINALMYDVTGNTFISDVSRMDTYNEYNMSFTNDDNRAYKLYPDNLTLAETTTVGNNKVMDKDLRPIDGLFEFFRYNGKIRMISLNNMSEHDCVQYKNDLKKSRYPIEYKIRNSKCIIDMDYFSGIIPEVYDNPEVAINIKEGSFDFNQTGYNSILAVEDYIDGDWGYKSNHASTPYKDTTVKIDSRYIFPILNTHSDLETIAKLHLKRTNQQDTTTSRTKILYSSAEMLSEVMTHVSAGNDSMLGASGYLGMQLVATAFSSFNPVVYVINLFGDKKEYADTATWQELYLKKSEYRTYPNIYGNDNRADNGDRFTYATIYRRVGTKERKDAEPAKVQSAKLLRDLYVHNYGLDEAYYDSVMKGSDLKITLNNPNLDWWENGSHSNHQTDNYNDFVTKKYNVVYYGATNTISIFVPYKSDYEVMAIDGKGNIVGKKTVYANEFSTNSNDTQPYKQVFFSLDENFDLAKGISDGNQTHACRYSNIVEWGGGVSGAYYSFKTPEGFLCDKSNDKYVKEHAAQFIAIRPLYSKKFNLIHLKHPLPFANRVFLVTKKLLMHRLYNCYNTDANCTVE